MIRIQWKQIVKTHQNSKRDEERKEMESTIIKNVFDQNNMVSLV